MSTPLKVLLAEDNPDDEQLLLRALQRAGFAVTHRRVDNEADYRAALAEPWDIVLSDYQMPQFTGLLALQLLREKDSDTPFILVSGTIGEDTAVEAMKQGATDYLLKDRLARLGQAVNFALQQHRLLRERRASEQALRQREAQLRENEAEFRLLFDANPMPMWVYEQETLRFLAVNDAAIALYGFTREEFLAMTLREIRPPEELPRLMAASKVRQHGVVRSSGWKHRRKDGSPLFADMTFRDMTFQGRRAQLVLVHDITERRIAESERRESDRRFRQLAESIPQVFWMTDREKRTTLYVSPAYAAIWGRSAESLFVNPRDWLDAVHPEDRARVERAVTLKQPAGTYDEEFRIVRPDGSIRWINDRAFPVRNEQGVVESIAGLATDITERKQLEEQFFRAQRLEAIGTLASGVAHDLNNILAPVLMAAGILKVRSSSEKDQDLLSLIERAAQRGAGIVTQLLTFSRGSQGHRGPLQARHLLNEVVHLMRETFPKNISIDLRAPNELWSVMADASQLHQVFMNLCVNARDAMPTGGTLTITAENCMLGPAPGRAGGAFLVIRVADTGHGMTAEIMNRIFDPFFTTKPLGQGTGLGLSTVIGIVKSHGGDVQVDSTVGRGTTFIVTLPAVESGPEPAPVPAAAERSGRGQLILAVDDEAPIRDTVTIILQSHHYRVITAADGQEAIRIFLEHQEAVCAVLTDLMMPLMGGLDLARALRLLKPGLPVIACTGLNLEEFRRDCAAVGIAELLAKPFVPGRLLAALERVLPEAGASSD